MAVSRHTWLSLGSVLLVFATCFPGNDAALEMNILRTVNLTPATVSQFKDVKLTSGMDKGSPAFVLGKDASNLFNEDKYKEFKRNFDSSKDITFVLTFKLSKTTVEQKQAAAFSLLSTNLGRQYLSFVIRVANTSDVGIEGAEGKDKVTMSIDITYRVSASNQLTSIKIGDNVNFEDWQNVMIRIIDHKTIKTYLGCNTEPKTQQLLFKLPKLPDTAQIRAAQSAKVGIFSGEPVIFDRIVGTVQRLEFLFSTASFEFLNPCIPRENTLRPEGLQSTAAEAAYLKRYLLLTLQNLPKTCLSGGIIYQEDEEYFEGKCNKCTCKNGEGVCETIRCRASTCTSGLLSLDGECCPVCQEAFCARTRKIYNQCGCTRKCGAAIPSTSCASRCTSGCHCPINTYENTDGNCVKQHFCNCKSSDGKTIYKPNQIASSNLCQTCICSMGNFRCIRFCFN